MRVTILSLLAANACFASPIMQKRQGLVSSASDLVTSVVPSSLFSETLSPTETGPLSSLLSPGSEMMPSATASASASMASSTDRYPGFNCPTGDYLVYVERQTNIQAPLETVKESTANFYNSSLFTITSQPMGEPNTIGNIRNITLNDLATTGEILTNYTMNNDTGAVYLTWNSTQEFAINLVTVSSYATEQQVYINATETSETMPVSTIKLFTNVCASNYNGTQAFFQAFFDGALRNATQAILMEEGMSSSMMESSTMMMSSIMTEPLPSTSSIAQQTVESVVGVPLPNPTSDMMMSSMMASPSSMSGSSGALRINTPPALVQCQPAALSFMGGQAPYYLSVLPAGQTSATPLLQFPPQDASMSYVWVVNLPAGSDITLAIRDATGNINYSSPITIQNSNDASCLATATQSQNN